MLMALYPGASFRHERMRAVRRESIRCTNAGNELVWFSAWERRCLCAPKNKSKPFFINASPSKLSHDCQNELRLSNNISLFHAIKPMRAYFIKMTVSMTIIDTVIFRAFECGSVYRDVFPFRLHDDVKWTFEE